MSRDTPLISSPVRYEAPGVTRPSELTLMLIRQFARSCPAGKRLNIPDNTILRN